VIKEKTLKMSRKSRARQWGRKPNTFTCGRCHSYFRARIKLEAHKLECKE